jgi:hypothetical protein
MGPKRKTLSVLYSKCEKCTVPVRQESSLKIRINLDPRIREDDTKHSRDYTSYFVSILCFEKIIRKCSHHTQY